MSMIFSFVKKHLKHYRKLNLIIAFLYIVTATFFIAETLSVYNYYISNEKQLDNIFGIHDGIFLCENNVQTVLEHPEIQTAGVFSVHALATVNNDFSNRPIILGTADENALSLSRIHLISGKMPQDRQEIAVEQSLLNLFYPDAEIGDEIKMYITSPELSEQTITFRLCGVLDNYSSLQWSTEVSQKGMVNAFVSDNLFRDSTLYSFVNIAFNGSQDHLQTLTDDLAQEQGIAAYLPNQRDNYDLFTLVEGNGILTLVLIMSVMFIFVIVILLVVSILAKKGRPETIGLLKIAGFDVNNILKFYRIKAVILVVPSVIIGMLAGTGLSMLIITCNESFNTYYSNIPFVLICGIVITLIAVMSFLSGVKKECKKSVMENQRPYNEQISKIKVVSYSGKNPVFLYAVKSFLMNTSGVAASSIMVFFSIITMLVTSYITSGMLNNAQTLTQSFDLAILSGNPFYMTLLQIPLEPEKGLYKSDYMALKKNTDVEEILGFQGLNIYRLTKDEVPKLYANEEEEDYLQIKGILGFPKELNLDECRLLGVENEVLEKLKDYVIDGKIDPQALSTGDEFIVCCSEKRPTEFKAGDTIRIAQVINRNSDDPSLTDSYMLDKEIRVGAVVQFSTNPPKDKLLQTKLLGFVWSEKAFEQIGLHMNYGNIYINTVNKENTDSLSSLVGQLCMYYNDGINVIDNLQQANATKKFYNSFSFIVTIISLGLAIFSLISLMLAVSAKLAKQRKVFGFLRAVGLTRLQMFQIILMENALSLGVAVILGLAGGLGLCIMLQSMSSQITSVFPISELLLLLFSYFLCIVLICVFIIRKFYRRTIINCIRVDE